MGNLLHKKRRFNCSRNRHSDDTEKKTVGESAMQSDEKTTASEESTLIHLLPDSEADYMVGTEDKRISDQVEKWEVLQRESHDVAWEKLKDEFCYRPNHFFLNLLVESIQFFKNFGREKRGVEAELKSREYDPDTNAGHSDKQLSCSDSLSSLSSKHILYRPGKDECLEAVTPLQIYVKENKMKIYPEEQWDELRHQNLENPESPPHVLCTELSRKHIGYARLRSVNMHNASSCASISDDVYSYKSHEEYSVATIKEFLLREVPLLADSSDENETDDTEEHEIERENESTNIETINHLYHEDSAESSNANVCQNGEKDNVNIRTGEETMLQTYSMNTIVNDQSIKNENEKDVARNVSPWNISLYPECFVSRCIRIKRDGDVYGVGTRRESRTYLSSQRYLECFADEFQNFMEISGKDHLAKSCKVQPPAVIMCEFIQKKDVKVEFRISTEFIPSLVVKSWPICALEWKMRERRAKVDPRTKTFYRWPRLDIIQQVLNIGCNLIPVGYGNPSQPNILTNIEWKIDFSDAERVLLQSLSHVQIRLLLLLEYLMRDHLSGIPGLTQQHLRHLLFWMCEDDIQDWEEERLGSKLKTYLKFLYNCLSNQNLPSYFVYKCNLLNSIPEKCLRQTQAVIRKMTENLPMYVMHTYSRMSPQGDFYPIIDTEELCSLLLPQKHGTQDISPLLLQLSQPQFYIHEVDMTNTLRSQEDCSEEHHQLKAALHRIREERTTTKNSQTADDGNEKKQPQKTSVNLFQRIKDTRVFKSTKLLSIFANHFIQMAELSNQYGSFSQAYRYSLLSEDIASLLKHAEDPFIAKDILTKAESLRKVALSEISEMFRDSC